MFGDDFPLSSLMLPLGEDIKIVQECIDKNHPWRNPDLNSGKIL
jgi:hypothetical protein